MKSTLALAALGFSSASLLFADASAPDKSGYWLLNPTPRELLRDLSTDRPDMTESPYTVDAGHVQIETDLFSYTRDHDTAAGADTTTRAWSFAAINFKVGLCNRADLQIIVESHHRVRTVDRVANTRLRQSGFGDITLRSKINLWGNDGGETALALMPFVKLPTHQDNLGNDAVEGGLIVPFAMALSGGWNLGMMTEVDFNEDADGSGHHAEFINTITVSRDIVGNLGGYVEFFSAVSTDRDADWVGTVNFGCTYGFTPDLQLDAGINLGVTDSAPDWQPFLGLTVRF
jgi:hypothetical protein